MQKFSGKVAVITGAGSGIGLAIASALSAEGMRVCLADVDDVALAQAKATLVASGTPPADVITRQTDVRVEADVDGLADRIFTQWGQVDVLVNNAGVFVGGLLWERPAADLEFVLGVNVWGILHGIRAFVPRMIAQGGEGHIVNTCSVAGHLGSPFSGPYGISKFAALAATESLALDLAATGSTLKVTALCPGMVDTNLANGSVAARPDALATDATEDRTFAHEMLTQFLTEGIAPAVVANLVVSAIRAEEFLVLTHEHHRALITNRAEELINGALPTPADFR